METQAGAVKAAALRHWAGGGAAGEDQEECRA